MKELCGNRRSEQKLREEGDEMTFEVEEMKALGFRLRDADSGVYENGSEMGSISVQKLYNGPRPWRAYKRGTGWLYGTGRRAGVRSFSTEVRAAEAALASPEAFR